MLDTMKTRAGRIALIVVGLTTLVTGAIFAGQGLNLIPGSFMTGDRTWLWVGLVLVVVGLVVTVLGLRRSGRELRK